MLLLLLFFGQSGPHTQNVRIDSREKSIRTASQLSSSTLLSHTHTRRRRKITQYPTTNRRCHPGPLCHPFPLHRTSQTSSSISTDPLRTTARVARARVARAKSCHPQAPQQRLQSSNNSNTAKLPTHRWKSTRKTNENSKQPWRQAALTRQPVLIQSKRAIRVPRKCCINTPRLSSRPLKTLVGQKRWNCVNGSPRRHLYGSRVRGRRIRPLDGLFGGVFQFMK